ncbi:MAG: adenine phosphoribosyltransferase [Endomicrobium sp.]|jgi:adenine phosphoribosyltransferase|nr:adenine phosphoribosyltransferase [Endomicrobium sp.]
MNNLAEKLAASIRDIKDFPKEGIVFKDITPVLKNMALIGEIMDFFTDKTRGFKIDKIVGIESRGFIFGMPLAVKMNVPFIPIRKKGKLPAETVSASYTLEYGVSELEIHKDAISKGENVLIVDDLLATGGTINAAEELIVKLGGKPVCAVFLLELSFLKGRENIKNKKLEVISIAKY